MRRKPKCQAVPGESSIDYVEHVRTAWKYINANAGKFAAEDANAIRNSILKAAQKYGVEIEAT
jgi:hypothetical protein